MPTRRPGSHERVFGQVGHDRDFAVQLTPASVPDRAAKSIVWFPGNGTKGGGVGGESSGW